MLRTTPTREMEEGWGLEGLKYCYQQQNYHHDPEWSQTLFVQNVMITARNSGNTETAAKHFIVVPWCGPVSVLIFKGCWTATLEGAG